MYKKTLLLLLCLTLPPGHFALADATTEAQLRAALQQSTTQIATLEDQVANLQAAQAPNVAMINALQAQLQSLKQGGGATTAQTAAQDQQVAALHRQLASQQAALGKLQNAYARSATTAGNNATANAQLRTQVAALNSNVNSCTAKNAELFKTGNLILDQLAHRDDLFSTLAAREPFIGLERVHLQNIIQDHQNTLLDNQIVQGQSNP